mmetsp:Transcript_10443/g.21581  ORF Transcript_10443/g.21581 Transcript_10443/m.21581 type:complete len:250 (-) Transcript_10443:191-940(-)
MPASKSFAVGSAIVGAAAAMPLADAFVALGDATRNSAPAALRGSAAPLAQAASKQPHGLPMVAGAAAGVAMVGGLVGAAMRSAKHKKSGSKVVANFSKEQQLGAQDPLGFWDPLDLCQDEATFKDYRAKELKHGRAAMMGAVGMLTQSIVQVPGMEGVPKSVNAIFVGNGMVGGLAVLALIGGLESAVFVQDEKKEPGNFGNPLPWFDDYSDEMRARELNNGRIAMFAAIGQIAAGLYTGESALEQFGL